MGHLHIYVLSNQKILRTVIDTHVEKVVLKSDPDLLLL
jgi:hypothetical protein